MPSATDRPADHRPYVFVSYASADRARVMPVVAALERAGVSVWLDQQAIAGGENYGTVIADAVKGSAALLLMASAASLTSRNVKQEIALGWRFERPYLPLLLEAVAIPDDVKYWLTAAQWVEVLDTPEAAWLPQVLTALAPLGITPAIPQQEEIHLAGREKEQTLLREKLVSAKGGTGGLVLIGGEAGIGKTTLADALCREAEQRGAFVLIGRCFDLAETPPYGPWVEAFRRYEPTAGLPPVPAAFAQRGTVGAVSSQSALFEQIHDFFAALTPSRPAVLLLDDYHWADAASLDLLRFLARDCAALPLLVLVTYRSDELTRRHPLYTLLPTLVRESSATRLDLRHLDDAAVRTLISQRYGLDEADVARLTAYLQARAEGNGLFLTELLRTLEEQAILHETADGWQVSDLRQVSIPALLRQVIDGRIARLGEEAQRLLAVAAIIGHEVAVDVWATIAQRDEEAMLTLIERAADAQVLDESADGTMVRFSHALIRETLVAGVSASRRRTMHRRVGETLAALPNADPDAVAYHFQQASDDRAAEWLLRAGERAQRAYAWLTAAARFEAALALREQEMEASERGWLLFRIALLRRHADRSQSLNDLESAEQAAIEAGDALLAAYARFDTGLVLGYQGQGHRCVTLMREAVAALDAMPAPDTATVARLRAMGIEHDPENQRGTLALWVENYGDYAEARLLGEQVVERIAGMRVRGGLDGAFAWDAYRTLGSVYAMLGQPVPARQMYDRNLDAYRAVGDSFQMGITIMRTMTDVILPYRSENHVERQRLADQVEEAFARARSVTPYPSRIGYFALLRLEGNWKEARDLLLALRAGSSSAWSPSWTASELGLLAWQLGDTTLAWTLVNEHFPHGAETAPGEMLFRLGTLLIRLAIALALDAGDRETAEAWLAMHDRWLAWSGAVLGQSEGEALWAGYHRIAGDTQQAYRHAEQALAHATEPRQPLALIEAHRLLGELDTDNGQFDDAARHLNASLALAKACAAPYERALAFLAWAELHAATGDTATAAARLDETRTTLRSLGALPALARADALVTRLEAMHAAPLSYPAGLSPREVEVLRLLAEGQTNRAIADALFLSEHTVRVHVRTILTKTNTANRTAAAAFARLHGLA